MVLLEQWKGIKSIVDEVTDFICSFSNLAVDWLEEIVQWYKIGSAKLQTYCCW
jgi:hypothetical protein